MVTNNIVTVYVLNATGLITLKYFILCNGISSPFLEKSENGKNIYLQEIMMVWTRGPVMEVMRVVRLWMFL